MDRDDYLVRLDRMLQDVGEFLQPDDNEIFLNQAVLIFSKDRPLVKVYEVTGDGSTFDFAMPSDWVENFSYIDGAIEYPVDDTVQAQTFLESEDWQLIKKLVLTVTTLYLRFKTFVPASGIKARFTYAAKHTLNTTTCTITDNDSNAVLALAAGLCYWALAARFAQHSDSTIEADVIDYARKSDIYKELALQKMDMYRSLMGIGSKKDALSAASAGVSIKDYDLRYPGGLGDYLTHPSFTR